MWLLNKISCEIQILNEKVWKLMIENGELEEENRKLNEKVRFLEESIRELRKEKENLKKEKGELKSRLEGENKKLREENERLRCNKGWTPEKVWHEEMIQYLMGENKKLKGILNRIKELYEDEEEAELLNYLDENLDEI